MATIRKRGNSYQIRVSCGYDTSRNRVVQTMTWKPADGMDKKQIEEDLQKHAILLWTSVRKVRSLRISSFRTSPSSGLKSTQS